MNVADLLEAHARERAHAVAVLGDARTIGYGALDRLVWLLAARLVRLQLPPGAAVALSFRSQVAQLVASLAALRAGVAQVSAAPDMSPTQRGQLLERTGTAAVLGDDPRPGPALARPYPPVELDALRSDRSAIDPSARREVPDATAIYVPGSGTTGTPRILVYSHRALAASIARHRHARPIGVGERHWC